MSGAQVTVEDSIVDADDNWVMVRERTSGLDTGQHTEYATALSDALGLAAGQALAANRDLVIKIADRDERIASLGEEKSVLIIERDTLRCQLLAIAGDTEGDLWDRDYLDLCGPATINIGSSMCWGYISDG